MKLNFFKKYLLCVKPIICSSEKHPHESILHFNDLLQLLDAHEQLNVFLLMGSNNKKILSIILRHFENNPERVKRIVICSRSPLLIYKVRLLHIKFHYRIA